jgi:hypothetical protein
MIVDGEHVTPGLIAAERRIGIRGNFDVGARQRFGIDHRHRVRMSVGDREQRALWMHREIRRLKSDSNLAHGAGLGPLRPHRGRRLVPNRRRTGEFRLLR